MKYNFSQPASDASTLLAISLVLEKAPRATRDQNHGTTDWGGGVYFDGDKEMFDQRHF